MTTTLTLSAEQLSAVQEACELYARLHIGQTRKLFDIEPIILKAWDSIDLKKAIENAHSDSDRTGFQIAARDKIIAKKALNDLIEHSLGLPSYGIFNKEVSLKARLAYDISYSIRRGEPVTVKSDT